MKLLILFTGVVVTSISLAQSPAPKQLTLSDAVSFALHNSPTLKGAEAEVGAARAQRGSARAALLPQVSLNGFVTKANMSNILQSGMGFEPQAFILAPGTNYRDANVTVMAPIYTGGRLSGLVSSASASVRASLADQDDMKAEVALNIREAYSRVLYGGELVKALQARVDAAQAMVSNAQAQVVAGKAIEATVSRAQAELADAQREVTMAQNDRSKMLLDLLAEMGASLESLPNLQENLQYKPLTGDLDSFIAHAEQNRGSLLAARQRTKAAKGKLASAQGATSPQLYGFAMGDTFSPGDPMANKSGYTAGLSLSIPVFDGGMRRSDIAEARAMLERAKADEAVAELRTSKEVRQTWLDIQTSEQNYNTAQAALTAAQDAYDVIVQRVENGKSILVEQLDALAALTRARANLVQAIYDHQIAVATLYRAVGLAEEPTGDLRP